MNPPYIAVLFCSFAMLPSCINKRAYDAPVDRSKITVEQKYHPYAAHSEWRDVHFGPAKYSNLNGSNPYYIKQADVWVFGTKVSEKYGQSYLIHVIPHGVPSLHYTIPTTISFGAGLGDFSDKNSTYYVDKVVENKIFFKSKPKPDPFGGDAIEDGGIDVLDLGEKTFINLTR